MNIKLGIPAPVLLIQGNPDLRDRVTFCIESSYDTTVAEATDLQTASACLTPDFQPELVIIDIDPKYTKEEFDKFWAKTKNPPILVFSSTQLAALSGQSRVIRLLDKGQIIKSLEENFDRLINHGFLRHCSPPTGTFCRIRSHLLLKVYPLSGDVYIRLSAQKYVKLVDRGGTFEQDDYEKYTVQKGILHLYVPRPHCKEFARRYAQELEKILAAEGRVGIAVAESEGKFAHETVKELLQQIGFTEEVQELTRNQVLVTIKSMGTNPKLATLFKKFLKPDGQYISAHSTTLAYFACALATAMEWTNDLTYQKLTLAAFLHDITLNNHVLAAVDNLAELETKTQLFTTEEIKEYKAHPVKAAELAKVMRNIPPDVDTILVQHHERPDGAGFPRGITHAHMSPLSTVFIVAHDLVHFLQTSEGEINLDTFLTPAKEKYTSSHFKRIIKCIEDMRGSVNG